MTTPSAVVQADIAEQQIGTWGVWDRHLRSWLATGLGDEREAWKSLLQVETAHPWELVIAQAAKDGGPLLTVDGSGQTKECPTCSGEGECFNCGHECQDCDGDGVVAA